jgi:hypothetical protein
MSDRELSVVAGSLTRRQKPKVAPVQDSIAKRWRAAESSRANRPPAGSDVIPLLDGWVRVLEKEARCASATRHR